MALWFSGVSCCWRCQLLIWTPVRILAAPFPIHFLATVPGKTAEDGPSTWVPSAHIGDHDETFGSWLWPGLSLTIWGVSKQLQHLSLSSTVFLSLFLSHLPGKRGPDNCEINWWTSHPCHQWVDPPAQRRSPALSMLSVSQEWKSQLSAMLPWNRQKNFQKCTLTLQTYRCTSIE